MEIRRIDTYTDDRFSKTVLSQHGAYLIGEEPYEVKITGPSEAIVRGRDPDSYLQLIEEFRFHAPHITRFYDEDHHVIIKYPDIDLLEIRLDQIQPSQFFIDEAKLEAVRSFVRDGDDAVIQVIPYKDRYISLDGHTRLYLAVLEGYDHVKAVISETDEWVWIFVKEAQKRKIFQPADMILVSHEKYDVLWNEYCDEVFASEENQ